MVSTSVYPRDWVVLTCRSSGWKDIRSGRRAQWLGALLSRPQQLSEINLNVSSRGLLPCRHSVSGPSQNSRASCMCTWSVRTAPYRR